MVRPEVILWPDPDRQWESVIPSIQNVLPELLVFGEFQPETQQGPAIWIKWIVSRKAKNNIPEVITPIIYLPGLSKRDLKSTTARLEIQPLIEYQYTGTSWLQENGKEWTILAFLQNQQYGMGIKVVQDNATKDAVKKTLSSIFEEPDLFFNKNIVDAEYFLSLVFPDVIPAILSWISEGEPFLNHLAPEKRESFINICKTRYDFAPDYKNVKEIVEKLGTRRNAWNQVWQYFANAPKKYPKIIELLRLAKPENLGSGVFEIPMDSWPQINEEEENALRIALLELKQNTPSSILSTLQMLESAHKKRRSWIWAELDQTPLANALQYLLTMAEKCQQAYPATSLQELAEYYANEGYISDQAMRKALSKVRTEKDKEAVVTVITMIYKPWIETITEKFQALLVSGGSTLSAPPTDKFGSDFILFVDAFRWDLAKDYGTFLVKGSYEYTLNYSWAALPTLTPTAKPACSPLADLVSIKSSFKEFRPQLHNGRDLLTAIFRDTLKEKGFEYVANNTDIQSGKRIWMEIGDIDTKGHEEQSGMVRRIEELFNQIQEVVDIAFSQGYPNIKIVTDHGWLLLPGGLPKKDLPRDLAETRWGRCALIKEGAQTDLLHLPWHWNQSVFIAYAPGISFFKNNEEYAHGGISLQECLVPLMTIKNPQKTQKNSKISTFKWVNLNCKIELDHTPDGYLLDIRTKFTDASSSIVLSAPERKVIKNGKCSLMVDDSSEGQAVWIVLMDPGEIIIDKQMASVGHQ